MKPGYKSCWASTTFGVNEISTCKHLTPGHSQQSQDLLSLSKTASAHRQTAAWEPIPQRLHSSHRKVQLWLDCIATTLEKFKAPNKFRTYENNFFVGIPLSYKACCTKEVSSTFRTSANSLFYSPKTVISTTWSQKGEFSTLVLKSTLMNAHTKVPSQY